MKDEVVDYCGVDPNINSVSVTQASVGGLDHVQHVSWGVFMRVFARPGGYLGNAHADENEDRVDSIKQGGSQRRF